MKQAMWVLAAALATISKNGEASSPAPAFAWLAGHWCSQSDDRRVDEIWLSEVDGSTQGISRTVSAGKIESFEFMRIETKDATTSFLAQPNGAAPTAFALLEHGARHASFANPANDFPDRIDYRREGDRLHARISGPGPDGGTMEIPFDYDRCD
jgi:hypothetical protein